jgi:hypothetical protein
MTTYEIGGLSVEMTQAAACRWNAGESTAADLRDSTVYLPSEDREITLRRAICERLEPEVSAQLLGMPANEI